MRFVGSSMLIEIDDRESRLGKGRANQSPIEAALLAKKRRAESKFFIVLTELRLKLFHAS
jgi:hypothetical protein